MERGRGGWLAVARGRATVLHTGMSSEAPPGTLPRAEAAQRLSLDEAGLQRLIDAGAVRTTPDGAFVTVESLLVHLSSRVRTSLASLDEKMGGKPRAPGGLGGLLLMKALLTLGFLGAMVELFSIQDDNTIVPLPGFFLGIAVVVGVCTWLARRQPDFSTTNGFGVTLYGKKKTPEGQVGTSWLVAAMIPLAPVRSFVILEEGAETADGGGAMRTRSYMTRPLPGIFWPQAAPVMVVAWAGIVLAGWVLTTMG